MAERKENKKIYVENKTPVNDTELTTNTNYLFEETWLFKLLFHT